MYNLHAQLRPASVTLNNSFVGVLEILYYYGQHFIFLIQYHNGQYYIFCLSNVEQVEFFVCLFICLWKALVCPTCSALNTNSPRHHGEHSKVSVWPNFPCFYFLPPCKITFSTITDYLSKWMNMLYFWAGIVISSWLCSFHSWYCLWGKKLLMMTTCVSSSWRVLCRIVWEFLEIASLFCHVA